MMDGGLRLVSGGTDNHLCLVDLTPADVTGKDAEKLLESVGITVNKNSIPNEPRSPFVTSGIRVGSAAATTLSLIHIFLAALYVPWRKKLERIKRKYALI